MTYMYSVYFVLLAIIVLFMEVHFYTSVKISCEAENINNRYAECYCLTKTRNLQAPNPVAFLLFYGWTHFFVLVQAIISYYVFHVGRVYQKAKGLGVELTIAARYVREVLVLVIVLGSIWISNKITGDNFIFYGPKVLAHAFEPEATPSPMSVIFPPRATCLVESVQSNVTTTAHCELPLNRTNGLVFFCLWIVHSVFLVYCLTNIARLLVEAVKRTRHNNRRDYSETSISLVEDGGVSAKTDDFRVRHSMPKWLVISIRDFVKAKTENFRLS